MSSWLGCPAAEDDDSSSCGHETNLRRSFGFSTKDSNADCSTEMNRWFLRPIGIWAAHPDASAVEKIMCEIHIAICYFFICFLFVPCGLHAFLNEHIAKHWSKDREIMLRDAKFGRFVISLCAAFMYGGGFFYHTIMPLSFGVIVTEQNVGRNSDLSFGSFVARVEFILNEVCLVKFVGCTMNICFLAYYFMMEWERSETISTTTYYVLLVSFTFNILIFCYIGEMLTEEMNKVTH